MALPDSVLGLDEAQLSAWIREQRWFGSKTQDVAELNVLERIPLSEKPRLELAIAEARFHAGTHELYQLLPGEPGGAQRLGELLAAEASADGVSFHARRAPRGEVRAIGAEQSNSSIVFGEELVLKVFRRLEPGINPELEMLRFLSDHDFENIADLAGWYELTGDRLDATLGVMQDFVTEGRDGWQLALDDPRGVLARAGDLGEAIARMHSVLGSDSSDPAFAPEEPSAEALALLTATIDEQIEQVFMDLPDDPAVAPIAGRGEEVRDRLQMLSHVGVGGRIIRHHGDLHLGQTMLTDARWIILDFEGEPARPVRERRRKRSPLRDVAGMLRSFAYAASASELLRGTPAPEGWEERIRAAFLEAYLEHVDASLLPAGEAATEKLLAIFELEKAVYELRYELDNRPDWVRIPVAGIARLLEGPIDQ